jgi:hypothetical protein
MHILIWLYNLTLSLDLLFDFTTYVYKYALSCFLPTYELHYKPYL